MTIKARIQRLEARRPANRLEDVPLEALQRFSYLTSKWFALGSLDVSEQADLLEISDKFGLLGNRTTLDDWEQFIESEWSDPELARQEQGRINEAARSDPAYRAFATEKTWCNAFESPRLAAQWWVQVDQSSLPMAVRARAADLLRRRVRNLGLEAEDIAWLADILQDFDLGPEGPWLADHLSGEAGVGVPVP